MNLNIYLNLAKLLIFLLLVLSFINSYFLGLSWDEPFHNFLGMLRFEYLKSFGEFKNFNFSSVDQFYPGLFDTISFLISYTFGNIYPNFVNENFDLIKHFINLIFSIMSLLGLYLVSKKIFNYEIAIFSLLFTILNPFFFGHISINPKDIIIFFSFIWSIYFFIEYLQNQKSKSYNIFLFSFFVGFGCGVRVTFIATLLPILLIGFLYILLNLEKFNLKKLFFFDFSVSFLIIFLITVSCWPQFWQKGFIFLFETIQNSFIWSSGPRLGLINGFFYETKNTPQNYFILFIAYRLPIFFSVLFLISLFSVIIKNEFYSKFFNNFNIKFASLSFLFFFPIIIAILLKIKIYDNIRLFIFELPLLSIFLSLAFFFIINNLNRKIIKILLLIISILFVFFIYRFVSLNPFQYSYVNYSFFNLSNSNNKFEHDYWNTSFKELIVKIKKNQNEENYKNYKIYVCGGDEAVADYYLKKYLNIKILDSSKDATHIIMTNRASFNVNIKKTCFEMFPGKDVETVSRNGLVLSTLRELKN